MNTDTFTTYEFSYRGYTIRKQGDLYGVTENGKMYGTTAELIELIQGIDDQWKRFDR
jgi:hypothetical protein